METVSWKCIIYLYICCCFPGFCVESKWCIQIILCRKKSVCLWQCKIWNNCILLNKTEFIYLLHTHSLTPSWKLYFLYLATLLICIVSWYGLTNWVNCIRKISSIDICQKPISQLTNQQKQILSVAKMVDDIFTLIFFMPSCRKACVCVYKLILFEEQDLRREWWIMCCVSIMGYMCLYCCVMLCTTKSAFPFVLARISKHTSTEKATWQILWKPSSTALNSYHVRFSITC